MRLRELIGCDARLVAGAEELEIAGLTADSREVEPGWLFAALAGSRTDGAHFIGEALAKGAVAILRSAAAGRDVAPGAAAIVTAGEPRRALARLAARFYAAQPDPTVAVTGTSGKTSVAEFARQIFAALGRNAASLGTLGLVSATNTAYAALTTPDPVHLQACLAQLAHEGVTHLAFEASSHGLDQFRLDGVRIRAAAFTNLGRDHLDYHASPEAYQRAKLRLFTELLAPGGTAVVAVGTAAAARVAAAAREHGHPVLEVGEAAAGEGLKLERLQREGFAQRLAVRHGARAFDLRLPLIGAYQAHNALLAAGLAIAVGEAPDRALAALERLAGVKGRLEIVATARGGLVVVDYAHKPDALAAALDALRPFASGRLVCIVGCGGDRDRGKRPLMGRIAAAKADWVIVTDDNPRSENPAAIRAEILAGAPGACEIGDRGEAIRAGVRRLGPGDVLLVAGKGHESGQIVGATVLPFLDHDAVLRALAEGAGDA
jgi:UDP-N-acetylmuramoyl-L-alanyl-D-glutamate--2,6-diaminopimelate ligase